MLRQRRDVEDDAGRNRRWQPAAEAAHRLSDFDSHFDGHGDSQFSQRLHRAPGYELSSGSMNASLASSGLASNARLTAGTYVMSVRSSQPSGGASSICVGMSKKC